MAKSKSGIRTRAGMFEHLVRIQLSEMRRLFIEEAPHSKILSAKFVLDSEMNRLEFYVKDKDRRMGIPYHKAMMQRLEQYREEAKAMRASSLDKYLSQEGRLEDVPRERLDEEPSGHVLKRKRRNIKAPVLGQPKKFVRRLHGPDSPFVNPMVGHTTASNEPAIVAPVRKRLHRILSSSSDEHDLAGEQEQGGHKLSTSRRAPSTSSNTRPPASTSTSEVTGPSTYPTEPVPSTSRMTRRKGTKDAKVPSKGSKYSKELPSVPPSLPMSATTNPIPSTSRGPHVQDSSSDTDSDSSFDNLYEDYRQMKKILKDKLAAKKKSKRMQ